MCDICKVSVGEENLSKVKIEASNNYSQNNDMKGYPASEDYCPVCFEEVWKAISKILKANWRE